jgi:hypothetical protein
MLMRTRRHKMTFENAFTLKGVDRTLSPGDYEVVTDEELIEELSFPVYRRVSTLIMLPAHRPSSIEMVSVSPDDLTAALKRDRAMSADDKRRVFGNKAAANDEIADSPGGNR